MLNFLLGALILVPGSAVVTQGAASVEVQPSTDSVAQRAAMRGFSMCLAKARPRWARETLAHPYLSKAQASTAAQALAGTDLCIRGPEADLTFRTSALIGSLAEHFIASRGDGVDLHRLADSLEAIKPLNASEDFALCVTVRDPAAARALALSQPGSDAEANAARKLARGIGPCVIAGEKPVVELQSLRSLVSVALYRGLTNGG